MELGGIFGLSAYLPLHLKLKEFIPADNPNKDTPIFLGHGDIDPVIKTAWGMTTAQFLKDAGWKVNLEIYQ
jgi:predicted esterase